MTMLHGLAMALADSVPGVSGGTIAFIMGFYERLLGALHGLFGMDRRLRRASVGYLIRFGLGWCVGMGASMVVLAGVFEQNVYFLSSLFLGLTVAAVPFIIYEERETLKGHYGNLGLALLGAIGVVALTALRESTGAKGVVSFQAVSVSQWTYLAVSGLLATCAMLLPGISGSTLLLILGVYLPAVEAVKEVLQLHVQYLPGVLALGTGVVLGVAFAANAIGKALARFRSQTIYLILGLMVGSVYAIGMGPTTLGVPQPPISVSTFHVPAFLIGVLILVSLEWAKGRGARVREMRSHTGCDNPGFLVDKPPTT